MSHPKRRRVVQLLRHIEESRLMRRINRIDNELHHLRSMRASQFESHVETDLTDLDLESIKNILFNVILIYCFLLLVSVIQFVTRMMTLNRIDFSLE